MCSNWNAWPHDEISPATSASDQGQNDGDIWNLMPHMQDTPAKLAYYAIIGSIADRGTSTCSAPYESGSIAPWSKKNRIPSLSTAKFW
ncbi:Uncharacterised protein [Mycobacteroides abscessus subsp. bolletii]|nr:Uncharacterised protein [Mycobacteroides abscessus subsp. bolletii]SKP98881.1 Uncharacterised protein [Mycobacteroides abscessus subsp. bolletii]